MSYVNTFTSKELTTVAGRIDGATGAAAVTAGEGFSLADTGTGIWTLSFDRAFDKLVSVVATSETADGIMIIGTVTVPAAETEPAEGTPGATIIFNGFDATDGTTAKDLKFSFITVWEVDT